MFSYIRVVKLSLDSNRNSKIPMYKISSREEVLPRQGRTGW